MNAAAERRRLALALWIAGMLGVVAFAALPPPPLAEPLPEWLLRVLGVLQNALLVALAVWVGVRLAPRVGLHAPAFEALAARRPLAPALVSQLLPALAGGVAGFAVLLAFSRQSPGELEPVARGFDPSLAVRVLYGGLTEEILLRWCVMTLLLWVAAGRPREAVTPGGGAVALAVVGSALLFGLAHLPTVAAYGGGLTAPVVLYVVAANALFGSVTGLLFWRWGLEAAMGAHALAHVLFLFWRAV